MRKMVGERLRKIREANGLKQTDIAQMLQVSSVAISQYETNKREPDVRTFAWYSDKFNVSVDWLFGMTDDPAPHTATAAQREQLAAMPADATLTDEQLAARLPEDLRESMMALIRIAKNADK